MLHYNDNSRPGYASFDHKSPFASQELPSNMLQLARSHHGKTYVVSELLPSVLPPDFGRGGHTCGDTGLAQAWRAEAKAESTTKDI
jgi:hypothetical protein